jgi:hypothetical protein
MSSPKWWVIAAAIAWTGVAAATPCPDADSDDYADCAVPGCEPGLAPCGDCDDSDPAVHPGATEWCNHRDDNCASGVDEGFARTASGERHLDLRAAPAAYLGWSASGIGDVNADGVRDFVVGAPYDDQMAWDAGLVAAYSGADRSLLWKSSVNVQLTSVGVTLAATSDMDGDGVDDVLTGAPAKSAVLILSGADGHEIARCVEPAGGGVADNHGLARLGDLDGDGIPEIAAGAFMNNERLHHQGKVTVFRYDRASNSCAIRFGLFDPEGAVYDNLGYSVAGIGDVTGDGVPDIAAGEPGDDPVDDANGAILIFSGSDGAFVRRITDPAAGWRDNLGMDLRGIEDLNGDHVPDIAASSERRYGWEGEVILFSGSDGSVLRRLTDASTVTGERVGGAFDVVDDVDGDGLDDILAGARYATVGGVTYSGRALVFSSATGAILGVLLPPVPTTSAYFGWSVAGTGDATGDGIPEFVVGAPYDGTATILQCGSFSVLAVESVCDGDGVSPFEGDCDDTDSGVWGRPSEARDLLFVTGKTILGWTEPADPGQLDAVLYDTLRSGAAGVFDEGSCLEPGGGDTSTTDTSLPGPMGGFYYLVRGKGACGDGDLGAWGPYLVPREAATCP